jgi:hypothetical protein
MNAHKSEVNPFPNVIFGDWGRHTVKLDFDEFSLAEVKWLVYRANEWFNLDGFLILESSAKIFRAKHKTSGKTFYRFKKRSYHVVFNRRVSWVENTQIMAWVSMESHNEKLKDYVLMQILKGSSTLRLSNKGKKPFPKPIFQFGNQDKQIAEFLATKQYVENFLKAYDKGEMNEEKKT